MLPPEPGDDPQVTPTTHMDMDDLLRIFASVTMTPGHLKKNVMLSNCFFFLSLGHKPNL
jgi:hypothetical protein